MISCKSCGYACACTQQEELDSCPHCVPGNWRVYTITQGNAYGSAITMAIRQSPVEATGRCFLTPKGIMLPLALWRAYRETNMWKKVHTERKSRKLFEEDVPPRVVPPHEAQA